MADRECWEWQGAISHGVRGGYGRIVRNGREYRAHRFFYERWVGPIPDGLELHHLCENKACINPDHLVPVTHAENLQAVDWSRVRSKSALCKNGHDDWYEDEAGTTRRCRTCRRERDRVRR